MGGRAFTTAVSVPLLAGLACGCSSPRALGTTRQPSVAASAGPSTTAPRRGPSAPFAAGTTVPGYRVGPLSFVSPSRGFGLVEFDTTGTSLAQQLVVTADGGVTWHAVTSSALGGPNGQGWTLDFVSPAIGYAWGDGLYTTHDGR